MPSKHLKSICADEITGEIICNCGCGYVLESKTSDPSKRDSISDDNTKYLNSQHHKQTNNTQHDGGLGTEITNTERTYENKKVNFSRFAKLQKQTRFKSNQRRIIHHIEAITNIINQNNLSKTLLTHCIFYLKKCEKDRLLENKNTKLASMCIVYLTCKFLSGYSYDPRRGINQNRTKWTTYRKYYWEFKPCFEKNKRTDQDNCQDKFILFERMCDELGISPTIRAKARSILQYCNSKQMFPTTAQKIWCATCIWIAVRNDNSYSYHKNCIGIYDIADAASTSINSITRLKRRLLENGTLSVLSLCNGIIKNMANYQGLQKTSNKGENQ